MEENALAIVRSGALGTTCIITKGFAGSNSVDVIIAHPNTKNDIPYFSKYEELRNVCLDILNDNKWLQPDVEQCITSAMLKNTDYAGNIFLVKKTTDEKIEAMKKQNT